MIGIIADPAEKELVREFFELFKTPWEFYRKGERYEVLLSTTGCGFEGTAKLLIYYAGRNTPFDYEHGVGYQQSGSCILCGRDKQIPIYGYSITFREPGGCLLAHNDSGECVAYVERHQDGAVARIGYDLFREVQKLLAIGQPAESAGLPTLELHIAFLRDLITKHRIPLVEIPPVPAGYQFIACLTHDVDHPLLRAHKWDRTAFGFLLRALFGSLGNLVRSKTTVRNLLRNWVAALQLPLIHLGLAKDFWASFADRYMEMERDLRSTFFVIPFKDRPGKKFGGTPPAFRASRYSAQDLAGTIHRLVNAGCEVALHGIDAWADSSKGLAEIQEIRRLTGTGEIGVRMHWLYYDQQSPRVLERAGAAYDSTIGYNQTVGYRAGTTQVFRPLGTSWLMELPLHIMDTALFYPAYLGLSSREAKTLIDRMLKTAVEFGGCLSINWHDRSVLPERLWDSFYRELIEGLRSRTAWFATAGDAVFWFRKRRSAVFETDPNAPGGVRVEIGPDYDPQLPGLRLRIYKVQESSAEDPEGIEEFVDMPVAEAMAPDLAK